MPDPRTASLVVVLLLTGAAGPALAQLEAPAAAAATLAAFARGAEGGAATGLQWGPVSASLALLPREAVPGHPHRGETAAADLRLGGELATFLRAGVNAVEVAAPDLTPAATVFDDGPGWLVAAGVVYTINERISLIGAYGFSGEAVAEQISAHRLGVGLRLGF